VSTFVRGRYARDERDGGTGAIFQAPPISRSSTPAKSEGLSMRGQQSQSTDPSRDTRATDRPSPIAA
jgi:hypothetical protein